MRAFIFAIHTRLLEAACIVEGDGKHFSKKEVWTIPDLKSTKKGVQKKQGGAISHLFFNSAYSIILLCLPQKNMCAEREGKKHLFTISAVCFLPSLPFSGSFRFFLALYARLFIVFALSNFA
jgi:hypothetical protein